MIKIKRIYEKNDPSDGMRVLIDRLWPRGLKKEAAYIDLWLKDIAPSSELRLWFNHDPEKWAEFKRKYHQELAKKEGILKDLLKRSPNITLLYSAKDEQHNNAVALQEYLTQSFLTRE